MWNIRANFRCKTPRTKKVIIFYATPIVAYMR